MPEVLNVHVNESTEKSTFEKENVIFFNTFLNFNLLYLTVVDFS